MVELNFVDSLAALKSLLGLILLTLRWNASLFVIQNATLPCMSIKAYPFIRQSFSAFQDLQPDVLMKVNECVLLRETRLRSQRDSLSIT